METTGEQETDVEEMDFGAVEPGINLYQNATFADRFKDDYSYISGDVISLSEKPMDDSNQSLVRSYSKEVDQVEELISSDEEDSAIKDDKLVEAERNTQVEGKFGSEVRKNHNDALEKTRPNPVAVEYCQTHTPHSCREYNLECSQCPDTGRKRRLSESSTLVTDSYITTTPPLPHLSKSNFKSLSPPLANLGPPSKDHAESLVLPGSRRALQTLEPRDLYSLLESKFGKGTTANLSPIQNEMVCQAARMFVREDLIAFLLENYTFLRGHGIWGREEYAFPDGIRDRLDRVMHWIKMASRNEKEIALNHIRGRISSITRGKNLKH
ncbi:hypothetical protein DL98DRAFT_598324 [Cadophora sp. DSE1049]|nr:hypothetical protein DL98DRAFT_598324 [Cadophora sp. DSE1049]